MRMLMKVQMPTGSGNDAIKDGEPAADHGLVARRLARRATP